MKGTGKIFQAVWSAYAQAFPTQMKPKHDALDFACAGIGVPLFNLAFPKSDRPISDADS